MTFNAFESAVSQFQLDPKRAEALRFYRQNQHNLALYMQTANNSSIVPFDDAAWRQLPMQKLERLMTMCKQQKIISESTDEQLLDLNPSRQTIPIKRCSEEKPSRRGSVFPYFMAFIFFLFFLFATGPVSASSPGRPTSGVGSQGLPVAKKITRESVDILKAEWVKQEELLEEESFIGSGSHFI